MQQNAFTRLDNRSPREKFWSAPNSWPHDTKTHEFAGRFILSLGKRLYGPSWTGKEPELIVPTALSERLTTTVPTSQIIQASAVLMLSVESYRERNSGTLLSPCDMPTAAEWAVARRLVDEQIADAERRFKKFLSLCWHVGSLLRDGVLSSATRPMEGGDLTEREWHFWNGEYAWLRFEDCRVDLEKPFGLGSEHNSPAWIFIRRAGQSESDLQAFKEAVPQEALKSASAPGRRGRRAKYEWDRLMSRFLLMMHNDGIPEDANVSELSRRLLDWAATQWSILPEEKTVQEKIRAWLAEYRAAYKSDDGN